MIYFGRNVIVLDGQSKQELTGFYQHGNVSTHTFYGWLQQVFTAAVHYRLFPCLSRGSARPTGDALDMDDQRPIPPGFYVLLDEFAQEVTVMINPEEPCKAKLCKFPKTEFRQRIEERDRQCCISGEIVADNNFVGFHATHIWPLNQAAEFYATGKARMISDPDGQTDPINSIQNGFLCKSNIYRRFIVHQIGIDPNDGYRITDFAASYSSPDGLTFYRNPDYEENQLPLDDFLREHFRQCILECLKGASKPEDSTPSDSEDD